METAARFVLRHVDSLSGTLLPASPEHERTLMVRATYLLSEEGRKASLLSGGDGRALQQITFTIPASRLHLVTVDGNGIASLKLRPRFELDAQQRIVRKDHLPTYDAAPTLDELLREAARNHQLEHGYQAERTAALAKRRELDRELRAQVARAFLGDPGRRALAYPIPTRTYCILVADNGRHLRFDISLDEGVARDVPTEAYRRFKADLRARRAGQRQKRATDLAVYDEKMVFVDSWVATYGTRDQQLRHAAGVLPLDEVKQVLHDAAFTRLNDRPLYVRDGAVRLQTHLRQLPEYADVEITSADLAVYSGEAATATAEQWNVVQEFRALAPDDDVQLRAHKLVFKQYSEAPTLTVFGVRVTRKVGPFVVQREYAAPDV